MNEIWAVFKAILDPLFIVFCLLLISLVVFLLNCKKKSDSLIIILCIILIYGSSIVPVSNYLCLYLEKDYIKNAHDEVKKNIDAIVVLGSKTKEIKLLKETFSNETGYLRLLHAVAVYHKTQPAYFVCTGKGEGDVSEAQTLAKLAEALGVPKDKIRTEANSTNTGENASEVNKIFGSRKVSIGLVTSAFHMKRSEREFRKYFDQVTPLPAHYLYSSPTGNIIVRYMPQSGELCKTSIALKEIIAQLWYSIK